ncbi:hypothetical protein DL95DRAFT_316407 [Leptodontidium sp. 2 PMI_412]|nr:hypothetical protein DL95DRAFT_316407 [Leptodontidium sp. 2 PMI_412]
MPPHFPAFKPFPTPHRIGTDICSIPRILSLLRGRHGHAFIRRVLRVEEREQKEVDINTSLAELDKEMGIADLALQKAAQFLAGRFAAKEATMKAHHSRRLTYHSILILKPEPQPGVEGSVAPVAIVMDEGIDGEEVRGKEVRISISHDGDYATAVCLAVDE